MVGVSEWPGARAFGCRVEGVVERRVALAWGGGKARGVGVPVTVYDSFLRFALFAIASAAFCSAAAFRFAAGWRAAASRPRALSSSIFLAFRASRSRCWLNVVSPAASVTAPSPVARRCHTSFTTATGPWPRVARNDLLGVCSSRSTPTSLPSLSTTGSSTCPEPPGLLTNAGDPFRFPLGTRAAPRTCRAPLECKGITVGA